MNLEYKIEQMQNNNVKMTLMEVCGTHTNQICKFGIRDVLGDNIKLLSGPGCPVCVTPQQYIDYMYKLSLEEDIIIVTYGDMIRVPGSKREYTLKAARGEGATVKIIYSPIEAIDIAKENKEKKVVFVGVGFETTAPSTAIVAKEALENKLENLYILNLHKVMQPAMEALLNDEDVKVDGLLCPGHVGTVIGEDGFEFLNEYKVPSVIAGFEDVEIIDAIYELHNIVKNNEWGVKNAYTHVVKKEGNLIAKALLDEVFDTIDDEWRGFGIIPSSGLTFRDEYKKFDIRNLYEYDLSDSTKPTGCACGKVLTGQIQPNECKLFGKACVPENPIGPCMVSQEGSCAAYFTYMNY